MVWTDKKGTFLKEISIFTGIIGLILSNPYYIIVTLFIVPSLLLYLPGVLSLLAITMGVFYGKKYRAESLMQVFT